MPQATEYVPDGGFASAAVVTTSYHITIEAPAAHAYHLVTHPSTWPQWNTFAPSASADAIRPGTRTTMQVAMDPRRPRRTQPLRLHVLAAGETATGYAVRWDMDGLWPGFLLRAARTQEFVALGAARCEYRTTEYMDGLLAYVIKYIYPTHATLKARFMDWCSDLRDHAEATWKLRELDLGG